MLINCYDNTDTNVRISVLGDKAYNGKLTFGEPIGITTGTAYIIVDFEVSLLRQIWPRHIIVCIIRLKLT